MGVNFPATVCGVCVQYAPLSCNDNQYSNISSPSPDGDPSNYLTYFKRAAVYLAMGQAKKALPDLDSCITIKPDFHRVREDGRGSFPVLHLYVAGSEKTLQIMDIKDRKNI